MAFAVTGKFGINYTQPNYVLGTDDTGELYDSTTNEVYDRGIVAPVIEIAQDLYVGEISFGVSYEQGYEAGTESFDAVPVYAKAKAYLLPVDIKPYVFGSYGKVYYVVEENVDMEDGQFYNLGAGLHVQGVDIEVGMNRTNATRNNADMVYGSFYITFIAGPEALEIIQ